MTSERVTVRVDEGVAHVRLSRPEKRNALDVHMFRAIAAAGEALKSEPGVRAVVLAGEGPSFCAGLDVSAFAAIAAAAGGGRTDAIGAGGTGDRAAGVLDAGDLDAGLGITDLTAGGVTHLAQQICWVWQELEVPVIAALQGHALGGGLQLALGADVRIARPDTQLSVREVHWGLIPDMTGTFQLARLVRPDVAKELTFTARVVDGREALALGLVTRLADDPLAAATALAAEIAGRSPDAVGHAKRLFGAVLGDGAAAQFARERAAIGELIGTPNQLEAIAAGLEHRPPSFS